MNANLLHHICVHPRSSAVNFLLIVMQQTILHHSLFALMFTPQPLHHSLHLRNRNPDIPLRVNHPFNLPSTNKPSHLRPRHQYLLHMPARLAGLHGAGPHNLIRLLPAHAPLCQLYHHSLAHVQPAHKLQVALDILRKEPQICNNTLSQFQDVVSEHAGLGEDHTLAGTVGQVPLIPQRIVQQFRLHHCPDYPGQPVYLNTNCKGLKKRQNLFTKKEHTNVTSQIQ